VRFSWLHPDTAAEVRALLRVGHRSWQELFTATGEPALPELDPPDGVQPGSWPRIARHVARAELVNEVIAREGKDAAERRFRRSPHAVERAALMSALYGEELAGELEPVIGVLTCTVDEWVAYGPFLARLVELGPFERFVHAASALATTDAAWPERVRAARGGLASLYARVGRGDEAHAIYHDLHTVEPEDTTVSIGAARAFLEAGETARAVSWLEVARERAVSVGRSALATRLGEKVAALRGRLN
jgi:hypothetical protein